MLKFAINLLGFLLSSSVWAQSDLPFTIDHVGAEQIVRPQADRVVVQEYRKSAPPKVVFSQGSNVSGCVLDGKPFDCATGATLVLADHARDKKSFSLTFVQRNASARYTIQVLPDDFPGYAFEGASQLKKDIYFTLTSDKASHVSHLLVLGPAGDIVFYRRLQIPSMDLKPHSLDNGKVFYSYFEIKEGTDRDSRGYRVLLDRDFNVVKKFPNLLDGHEFQLLSEDHFVSIVYETKKDELNRCILEQKVVEYKDGKLVFELGALELLRRGVYYSVAMPLRFFGETCIGFFHLNSAELVSKDLLLVGMGFQTFLAYNPAQKKIEWILGGVSDQFGVPQSGYGDMYVPLFHSPVWNAATGTLTLFDNGLLKQTTRIVQFDLDIKNKKINRFETLYGDGVYANAMGSVEVDQVDGESVLSIGWGHKRPIDPSFSEVSNKKAHLTVRFNNPDLYSYKVYRY